MVTTTSEKNWKAINRVIWTYFIVCFVALWTPPWKFLGNDLPILVCGALGASFGLVREAVGEKLKNYEPASIIDAKRTNEQIKSLAAMINTVAAGTVSVFVISEIAKNHEKANMVLIMGAIGIALFVHNGARSLLGHLKDEVANPKCSRDGL